jgi:hypothetical protein
MISSLREKGNSILLMMDANGTIEDDKTLRDTIHACGLHDLHQHDPPHSTYIGTDNRRIDFIFGCPKVLDATVRSGTLSYTEGPQSDHRSMYVDLDPTILLDYHPQDNAIQPPQSRPLKTGNPETVALYHQLMLAYYEKHKMIQRIEKLFKQHSKMPADHLRRSLEKWDRDQGRAMRYAEKSLTRKSQKYSWSPTLRNAGLICRYWHLRVYGLRSHRDMAPSIFRLQNIIRQHDPDFMFPMQYAVLSMEEVLNQWKLARKELKLCQKNARSSGTRVMKIF